MNKLKIAAIVRADNSGIANVTWEFAKHLKPSKVLIIVNHAFDSFFERYKGVPSLKTASYLTADQLEWLSTDVDILWTAETFYDWNIVKRCRRKGVKTVLTTMFEMTPERLPYLPDLFHCPSKLDLEIFEKHFSGRKEFVAWPVNTEALNWRKRTKARHFIHPASHGGLGGRKGTQLLLDAMKYVKSDIKLTVYTWKNDYQIPADERIEVITANFKNYWQIWRTGDVLVYPQGANGICLPVVEAMTCGLGVISTDIYPFNEYLPKELLFKPSSSFRRRMARNLLEVEDYKIEPQAIAEKIDQWANKDISQFSEYGREWAKKNSWQALLPKYVDLFQSLLK